MSTYAKPAPANKAASSPQTTSHTQNDLESALQTMDKRPAAGQLRQLQKMADTGPQIRGPLQIKAAADTYSARQLQTIQLGRGSHNKTKMLNVQGSYTQAGVTTNFKDRDEDISLVKGHGGYEDEDDLAEAWVRKAYRLAPADTVTITEFNFFTKR